MKSNLYLNNNLIEVIHFKGGEIQILTPSKEALEPPIKNRVIRADIKCSDGIMALCQLKDLVDSLSVKEETCVLELSYVPYGRYDRRMPSKEFDSQSLKVFAKIINSLNFSSVIVCDPHSYVIENVIDRCHVISQETIFTEAVETNVIDISNYAGIIAPDLGSINKATIIASKYNLPLIKCNKQRSEDNSIASFEVILGKDQVLSGNYIIIDDICDGGRTYLAVCEALRSSGYTDGYIDLFVTHGIFSYGVEDLLQNINNIYCGFSWIDDSRVNSLDLF